MKSEFYHLLYTCKEMLYSSAMIESFMHKGLEELFEKGKSAKVQASLADRVSRRLDAIDTAKTLEALRKRGFIRFCRSRESGNPVKSKRWIPAFAGMTN